MHNRHTITTLILVFFISFSCDDTVSPNTDERTFTLSVVSKYGEVDVTPGKRGVCP